MLLGASGISTYSTRMGMSCRLRAGWASGMNMANRRKPLLEDEHKKKPSASVPKAWDSSFRRTHFFISSFICAFFHFALCHLDRHDVNFVLGGILMGFERYLVPFMALQGLWVAQGPALVVLVDERFFRQR